MTAKRRPLFRQIRAGGIGYRAHETLAAAQQASVLGTTSRGLFLQSAGRWLVFISYERYLSPLTLTVQPPTANLRAVEAGESVLVEGDRLRFPGVEVDVLLPEAVWRPDDPPATLDAFPERMERLQEMVLAVAVAGREQGLSRLLPPLLSQPIERPLPAEQQSVLDAILSLRQSVRAGDGEKATEVAGRLLGRGRGLTASGDDFLIGFLLFANRHRAAVRPDFSFHAFRQALVDAAYHTTTRISANLLEAAADGHSDERLLATVDCIATGHPSPRDCLPPLLGWGASSGVDALAGMVCAATL